MLDFIYDWLFYALPSWAQSILLGVLLVGIAAMFGAGWYFSTH